MKLIKKVQVIILTAIFAVLCSVSAALMFGLTSKTVSADSATYTDAANYYGKRLTDPVSVAFYEILESMDFASGESKQIYDKDILDEAALYTVGDPSIIKKLGAAVDSFKYDHTEYFYVDFDMLTINVKTRGNTLIVELGAGRSDTYFVDGFTTENIPAEVDWYNNELNKFVNNINVTNNATAEQKAKAVTKAVAEKVSYSFCVDNNGTETEGAAFIRTAYGALKYGKCVCEGYSRIFKAAMDKLGVVNVLVNGWLSDVDVTEAHMWNLVQSGNGWYGVDPTVADGDRTPYNANGLDWAQGELLCADHFEERVISTSNYEMPFPSIYRNALPSDSNVFSGSGLEIEYVVKNEGREVPYYTIVYNGKNAKEVTADLGYYVVVRTSSTNQGAGEQWSNWTPLQEVETMYENNIVKTENGITYYNLESMTILHMLHLQFGVASVTPDQQTPISQYYSDEVFNANCVVKTDNVYSNLENDPDYRAPVYATAEPRSISLDTKDGEQPKSVTVKYSQPLEFTDGSNEPKITLTAKYSADDTDIPNIGDYAYISGKVSLSEDKTTLSFIFQPSISYSHNEVTYTFSVTNMQCKYTDGYTAKAKDFMIVTKRTAIICSRVYGDGRLYIDAFATPTLVDNSDLSVNGWSYLDKDGVTTKKVSESQRSQLALVVKQPKNAAELENAVENKLSGAGDLKMSTYELDLSICSRIATIPEGSYMKLSFGFPAGITAEDEGVEFEVFHFKKKAGSDELDYDKPERLNCVVTKYGLTVTVNSFSPFVIVARDSTAQDSARKGIVTALNGVGGTVTADTKKPVNFLSEAGQSVTYTFLPDSGYAVEYVLLGDKELIVENGKVTVNYNDLTSKSNILSVGFAKQSVLDKERAAGEVNAVKSFAAKTYNKTYAAKPVFDYPTLDGGNPVKNGGLKGGIIALIVILVVVALAGAGVLGWYLWKKKFAPAAASSSGKSGSAKTTKKTTAKKATVTATATKSKQSKSTVKSGSASKSTATQKKKTTPTTTTGKSTGTKSGSSAKTNSSNKKSGSSKK